MSARKIKNSWWADFRFQGQRYRLRSPENSRAGAASYESVLRQKLAQGEAIDSRSMESKSKLFAQFVWEWFEMYVKVNNKPSTLRAKSSIIRNHLVPYLGKLPLAEITSARLEQYKATKLSEGLSPKSINNQVSVLHTCLTHGCDWGYLETIPRIKWLKAPPQKFKYFTKEEYRQLLQAAAKTTWHDMILCALHTGMRISELSALDWSDVNLQQQKITVRRAIVDGVFGSPKNNRIRHLPISNELYAVLSARTKKTGLVFTNGGRPIPAVTSWEALQAICEAAGLQKVGWHSLRHTFASVLVASGVPMRAVQMLLGHSSIQMTERYSHLAPSSFHEAIAVLDNDKRASFWNFGQPVGNRATSMMDKPLLTTDDSVPR